MFDTYLGTTSGVYRLCDGAMQPLGLADERIWAIHAWRDHGAFTILAGSYGNGLYRSEDGGETWSLANTGLTASAFRCIVPDPLQPGTIIAGTEPARLYRSGDGGKTWQELAGITQIAGYDEWFLPYSPRAGAVRNVYAPPGSTGRLFASVEVGGLLQSDDGGETWTCAPVIEDDDIHFITGHPARARRFSTPRSAMRRSRSTGAMMACGGSVASPARGMAARPGKSWRATTRARRSSHRPRPDLVLAGPSPQVGRGGRIVVSSDGGDTWEPASAGLDTPMADMVEVFVAAPDDTIWAVCSGGRLLHATPGEWHWHSALPADAGLTVQSVAFVPRDT